MTAIQDGPDPTITEWWPVCRPGDVPCGVLHYDRTKRIVYPGCSQPEGHQGFHDSGGNFPLYADALVMCAVCKHRKGEHGHHDGREFCGHRDRRTKTGTCNCAGYIEAREEDR